MRRARVNLTLLPEVRDDAALIALAAGFIHGDRGSIAQLTEAMLSGQLALDPGALRPCLTQVAIPPLFEAIARQQPFTVHYDSGRSQFSIRCDWGEILSREGTAYLSCHGSSDHPSRELPGLENNWLLRLDRIRRTDPEDGPWGEPRSALARLHLFGRLADNFRAGPGDRVDGWLDTQGGDALVVERSFRHGWLLRQQVLAWGDAVELVTPEELRTDIRQALTAACDRYCSR